MSQESAPPSSKPSSRSKESTHAQTAITPAAPAPCQTTDAPATNLLSLTRDDLEQLIEHVVSARMPAGQPRTKDSSIIELANQLAGESPEDYAPSTTPLMTRAHGLNEILARIVKSMQSYTEGEKHFDHILHANELREHLADVSLAFNQSVLELFERYGSTPVPLRVPLRLTYQETVDGQHHLVYRVKYLLDLHDNTLSTAICEINGIKPPPTYLVTLGASHLGYIRGLFAQRRLHRHGNLSKGDCSLRDQRPLYLSTISVQFFVGASRAKDSARNRYLEITDSSSQSYKNIPGLVSRLISEAEIPTHYIGLAALVAVLGSAVTLTDHLRGPPPEEGNRPDAESHHSR